MKVHVVMGVHMIQLQSRFQERLKLRTNLLFQLSPDVRPKEKTEAGASQPAGKNAATVHEARHFIEGQHRTAFYHDQVQTHSKGRERARPRDSVVCSGAADHQTGRGENSAAVRLGDGLIHRCCQAEIVTRDNQPPHVLAPRARSLPSRVRVYSVPRQMVVRLV